MLSDRLRSRRSGLVLMYHRVADLALDPWGLAVTEQNFEAHIRHLAERWSPTPLRRIALDRPWWTGRRPPVAVTFDDGYADNLERAVPILQRYEVPATVFITTGVVDGRTEFWWDQLEHIFLTTADLPTRLPDDVVALLGYDPVVGAADLATVTTVTPQEPPWRAWEPYRHPRHELFHRTWQALYDQHPAERARLVEALGSWAGCGPEARRSHRTVSRDQLAELAAHPLVDCQAHSTDHTSLPTLTTRDQRTALTGSRTSLEALLGTDIDGFAYPHGDISPETVALAAEAGYAYCCTTEAEPVLRSTPRHAIPRCGVGNWVGPEFETRIRHWWDGRR